MDKTPSFRGKNLMCREKIKNNKKRLAGIFLILLGVALGAISRATGGSGFQDFVSGILLGLSIGVLLVGILVMLLSFIRKQEGN